MLRLIIPLFAALAGLGAVLASGGLDETHLRSGSAFLTLIEASHAAAVAGEGAGR